MNAIGKCVGNAHSKLKLFLHMACSVPNHMNKISTPIRPIIIKKKKSNILKNKFHELRVIKPNTAISKNKTPKTIKGVMPDFVLYDSK